MPLIYKPFKSQLATKKGEKLYYPRLIKMGKIINTQKIGEMIAEKASLTPGDVHSVIRNLMSTMREQLLNSRSVRLDGLGTFTMIARAGGKGVKTEKEVNSCQITGLRCRFTPEYTHPTSGATTRALTEGVEYIKLSELLSSSGEGYDDDDDDYIDPNA